MIQNILQRIMQVAFFLNLSALILFLSAGNIVWVYGWAYVILTVLVSITGAFVVPPETISERGQTKENTEKWDRIITSTITLPYLVQFLIFGLDERFEWSPDLGVLIHIGAMFVYIAGNALATWAMVVNRYFSTVVRIQYERDHQVCSDGPYRFVRHPGYLGIILYFLATPVFFGSFWGYIPTGIVIALLITRTILEDRTLLEKLEGYRAYADRVKYRLLPGVW